MVPSRITMARPTELPARLWRWYHSRPGPTAMTTLVRANHLNMTSSAMNARSRLTRANMNSTCTRIRRSACPSVTGEAWYAPQISWRSTLIAMYRLNSSNSVQIARAMEVRVKNQNHSCWRASRKKTMAAVVSWAR
ncbi:hypothetical protein D9M68_813420 [compost metagenome]